MHNRPLKIVAWIHHGLGDVIMTLPMLCAIDTNLRTRDKLVLVVKSELERELLSLISWKHMPETLTLGNRGQWDYLHVIETALAIRSIGPDVFIAPHASPGPLPPLVARLSGSRCSVGPRGKYASIGFDKTVLLHESLHKVHYYSKFAETAGLYEKCEMSIPLRLSEPARQKAEAFMGQTNGDRWVVLAPGSSPVEKHKLWPVSSYALLISRITQEMPEVNIALLGGARERAQLEALAGSAGAERVRVFAQSSLELSVAIISKAACLVSSCTGVAHMAALTGTPIVGLYGPTNHSFTGPYTHKLRLVRRGYRWSPCYRYGFIRGCGNPVCMTDITVLEVFKATQDALNGHPFPGVSPVQTTTAVAPDIEIVCSDPSRNSPSADNMTERQ